MTSPHLTRRDLLVRSALLGVGVGAGLIGGPGLALGGPAPRAVANQSLDYTSPATYDWLISQVSANPKPNADEYGRLSWERAPLMVSLLTMFRATGDSKYLDGFQFDGRFCPGFVHYADQILDLRDNVRGVSDHLGNSLPRWRQGTSYTTGSVIVPDPSGRPMLEVRIGLRGNAVGEAGTVTVSQLPDGRYAITSTGIGDPPPSDEFAGLSLDPASADYIVDRLYWAEPNVTKTTAVDLRTSPAPGDQLVTGSYAYTSEFSGNLTGAVVIGVPLAWFAALVQQDEQLHSRYLTTAMEYAQAVDDAFATFEPLWREDGSHAWYTSDPDAPSIVAGADYPHNQNQAAAAAYLYLSQATQEQCYRQRAEKLLNRFVSDLTPTATGYDWYYYHRATLGYQGWTREDHVSRRIPYWGSIKNGEWRGLINPEDLGHAYLDLLGVRAGFDSGLVITSAMMQRFGRTFADQILTVPAGGTAPNAYWYVNGTGALGNIDRNGMVGPWCQFAGWAPEITDAVSEIMTIWNYQPTTHGGNPAMSAAYLVEAALAES